MTYRQQLPTDVRTLTRCWGGCKTKDPFYNTVHLVAVALGPTLSYCKQFSPLRFGPRVSDYVSLSKQRVVAMLLLALLSASLSPMFPLVAFPCYFLPGPIPLTQLCKCCLPQEKLQSPDQQSKTGGFWELHVCGGEPAGKGQLHWHC